MGASPTGRNMQQKSILFITTADTDILTADRALSGLPRGTFRAVVALSIRQPCQSEADGESAPPTRLRSRTSLESGGAESWYC